jgi:putative chitinase
MINNRNIFQSSQFVNINDVKKVSKLLNLDFDTSRIKSNKLSVEELSNIFGKDFNALMAGLGTPGNNNKQLSSIQKRIQLQQLKVLQEQSKSGSDEGVNRIASLLEKQNDMFSSLLGLNKRLVYSSAKSEDLLNIIEDEINDDVEQAKLYYTLDSFKRVAERLERLFTNKNGLFNIKVECDTKCSNSKSDGGGLGSLFGFGLGLGGLGLVRKLKKMLSGDKKAKRGKKSPSKTDDTKKKAKKAQAEQKKIKKQAENNAKRAKKQLDSETKKARGKKPATKVTEVDSVKPKQVDPVKPKQVDKIKTADKPKQVDTIKAKDGGSVKAREVDLDRKIKTADKVKIKEAKLNTKLKEVDNIKAKRTPKAPKAKPVTAKTGKLPLKGAESSGKFGKFFKFLGRSSGLVGIGLAGADAYVGLTDPGRFTGIEDRHATAGDRALAGAHNLGYGIADTITYASEGIWNVGKALWSPIDAWNGKVEYRKLGIDTSSEDAFKYMYSGYVDSRKKEAEVAEKEWRKNNETKFFEFISKYNSNASERDKKQKDFLNVKDPELKDLRRETLVARTGFREVPLNLSPEEIREQKKKALDSYTVNNPAWKQMSVQDRRNFAKVLKGMGYDVPEYLIENLESDKNEVFLFQPKAVKATKQVDTIKGGYTKPASGGGVTSGGSQIFVGGTGVSGAIASSGISGGGYSGGSIGGSIGASMSSGGVGGGFSSGGYSGMDGGQSYTESPPLKGKPAQYEQIAIAEAKKAGIQGTELAAFMAQIKQESGGFKYTRELGKPSYFYKYANKNGNRGKEDAVKYKGRGFMQVTGRAEYAKVSKQLGVDLLSNPQLLEQPIWAARSAIAFWKGKLRRFHGKGGKFGFSSWDDTKKVTKLVNGGYNHLSNRQGYFAEYKKKLMSGGIGGEQTQLASASAGSSGGGVTKSSTPSSASTGGGVQVAMKPVGNVGTAGIVSNSSNLPVSVGGNAKAQTTVINNDNSKIISNPPPAKTGVESKEENDLVMQG